MKNYKSEGKVVTFLAPNPGVTSGVPVLIGGLFIIPTYTAATGAPCEGLVTGVVELPKLSTDTPTQFQTAYWDIAEGNVTTVVGTTPVNKKIGVFMDALVTGTTTADVRLNGIGL